MKSIITHINEKLQLNRNRVKHYKYEPETKKRTSKNHKRHNKKTYK